MTRSKIACLALCSLVLVLSMDARSQTDQQGLLDLNINESKGQLWLSLPDLPVDYLYVTALQTGLGSNDIGMDRGQLSGTRWIRFEKYGNRVLMIEPNLDYRAISDNAAERAAVTDAFSFSVIAGFEIDPERPELVSIDLAPLLLSDITRIGEHLEKLEQGTFELDSARSAIEFSAIKNFPDNTLIPAIQTFAGSKPGEWVRQVTPTDNSISIKIMHQLARMPDEDYKARSYHPRAGYWPRIYQDYAAPLGHSMETRIISRHMLTDGQPLVYYVDNATPEPIRSALLEGASWWSEAFSAAGHEGQFKVEVLPADADPLDLRYNVIQWVHRATRGWSYGDSVVDPRNGRILKGHVTLGSLRVRQDQLIAEALTAPFVNGDEESRAAMDMALARLRQLSAHEVGHTLGINHNYAASSFGDKSVMDYPHPNLYLDANGKVSLERAYQVGISEWDKLTIRYGYTDFADGEEHAGLQAILQEASDRKIRYITGQDSSAPGSAHVNSHLWDNGTDPLKRLDELLQIRAVGLTNFSPAVIRNGTPNFEMEQRLVPVYLLHRYQLKAVGKILGGMDYDYRVRGEGGTQLKPVPADRQIRALNVMLEQMSPENLALPANLQHLLPPPAASLRRNRETFSGLTGTAFDHLSPARAGVQLVLDELLNPVRLARLLDQHALDPKLPGAWQVIDAVSRNSWPNTAFNDSYLATIQSEVNWLTLASLQSLAGASTPSAQVRSMATAALIALADRLADRSFRNQPMAAAAINDIEQFLMSPKTQTAPQDGTVPPGSPIGQ